MTAVNGAFVLRNLLETLTGDNPELALTSRDFNVDLFHRFPELVSFYLKNKEQVIASTLALSTNPSQYGLISRKLEQLASSAIDPSNRFKLIQSEFNNLSEINRPTVETSKPSQVGFYANTPNTNKKTAIKSPLALIDSDDEDDKDIEDDLSTSCFSIPCCNLI